MTQNVQASMPRQMPHWNHVVGGACWIASLVFLVGQAIAQAAWTTPYSIADDTISDLGTTSCGEWPPTGTTNKLLQHVQIHYYVCSPLNTVMNASFILTGVVLLLGLYLTRDIWPRRRLTTWGIMFLTLAGIGKIIVGLDPENVRLFLHSLGALGIPFANIGILLLGLAVWRTRRGVDLFSVGLGILGLLGYLALLALSATPHGVGAAERVADYSMIVWMVVLGIGLVLGARSVIGAPPPVQSP